MLSIIICTYKRPQLLNNCLVGAMQVLEKMDAEVIVINDSPADPVTVPQHPKVRLYNNTKRGLASARNLGAVSARGELLLFLDDDIEFDLKNVDDMLAVYAQRPPACYNPNWKYSDAMTREVESTQFGRFLIKHKLINYRGWVPGLNWQDTIFEVKQVAGFFMLMPKVFFDRSGGFNEEFINQGTEDDELCVRLAALDVKMFIDPQIYVFHNELDRISLESRVHRYYNGAVNRRKALDLGIEEYRISYTPARRLLMKMLLPLKKALLFSAGLIPNKLVFDPLYFRLSHVLIAIAIYEGYSKND